MFDPTNEFSHLDCNPHYRRIQRLEKQRLSVDPHMRAHAETWQEGFTECLRLMTEREDQIKEQICVWLEAGL